MFYTILFVSFRAFRMVLSATSSPDNVRSPLYGACPSRLQDFSPANGLDWKRRFGHGLSPDNLTRRLDMLRWALIFFVVALLAAVLGFTGIAVAAAGIAKVLFFLFVILFLITLLGHVARRP